MLRDIVGLPLTIFGLIARGIEKFLFVLVEWYDLYVYTPLQTTLFPLMCQVPRYATIGGTRYTVFSANIVSWARTLLVVPVAICLKFHWNTTAFLLVLFHDFLDHVDGIVAKAQKQVYGPVDDPLLGGFMDAFCDKIVNVLSLWTIMMVTDFSTMNTRDVILYVGACTIIIGYEFILGVVRVQDYFNAYYKRLYKKSDDVTTTVNVAAVMEGKLKEKLESLGIAFLCLSQSSSSVMHSMSGSTGVICLLLSVRLAHASLSHKMKARKSEEIREKALPVEKPQQITYLRRLSEQGCQTEEIQDKQHQEFQAKVTKQTKNDENNTIYTSDNSSESETNIVKEKPRRSKLTRARSLRCLDGRVDRVYTVGCFDLFHYGHIRLLERMRTLGKEVVVGVHDSRSIFNLKQKVPIDSTEKRMRNVKQYADIVFCVAGTDPTGFIYCIVNENDDKTCMYVRGDDMENFPARELCERLMKIKFLPYSEGVSSSKLRKEMLNSSRFGPHAIDDPHAMFY